MNFEILKGILIPFFGTSLGAACVFFLKKDLNPRLETLLNGFAAGVMAARIHLEPASTQPLTGAPIWDIWPFFLQPEVSCPAPCSCCFWIMR